MSRKIQQKLSFDWFGHSIQHPLGWRLTETNIGFRFDAQRDAVGSSHPRSQPGVFREELWRSEVAEIFFSDLRRERYLEINLAPNGAWWLCAFDGVRQRNKVQPDVSGVCSRQLTGGDSWSAEIFLPRQVFRGFEPHFFNVTAILDCEPQRFLSTCHLPGVEPDFHQPAAFQEFVWQEGT